MAWLKRIANNPHVRAFLIAVVGAAATLALQLLGAPSP